MKRKQHKPEGEAICSCGGGENDGHSWNCPWQEGDETTINPSTKRPIHYLDECIKSSPQMIKENSSIPTKASESSWDDVWKEFISDKKLRKLYSISLFDWLKQNFNPPLKR